MAEVQKIGSKRHVVGAGYGLKDWLAQRVTAVVLGLYVVALLVAVLCTPSLDYGTWKLFFSFQVIHVPVGQLFASIAMFSLVYHAWIGIRDLWMDYVKCVSVRLTLYVLTIIWLFGSFVYSLSILWRL